MHTAVHGTELLFYARIFLNQHLNILSLQNFTHMITFSQKYSNIAVSASEKTSPHNNCWKTILHKAFTSLNALQARY